MGTHPIFESDFDCLTESCQTASSRRRPIIQAVVPILAQLARSPPQTLLLPRQTIRPINRLARPSEEEPNKVMRVTRVVRSKRSRPTRLGPAVASLQMIHMVHIHTTLQAAIHIKQHKADTVA